MIFNGFDFNHPDFKKNGLERQRFYLSNYDKPVTEEQFVAEVKRWPRRELHNSQSRSAAASRHRYRYLVRKYGFFSPTQQPAKASYPNGTGDARATT